MKLNKTIIAGNVGKVQLEVGHEKNNLQDKNGINIVAAEKTPPFDETKIQSVINNNKEDVIKPVPKKDGKVANKIELQKDEEIPSPFEEMIHNDMYYKHWVKKNAGNTGIYLNLALAQSDRTVSDYVSLVESTFNMTSASYFHPKGKVECKDSKLPQVENPPKMPKKENVM